MSAFGFSADDLEANQRAQLSAAQQQAELARRAHMASVARGGFSFLLLFYPLVLVAIGVALYITGTLAQLQRLLGELTLPVFGGVIALALVYVLVYVPLQIRRGARKTQAMASAPLPLVGRATGAVKTKHEGGGEYGDDLHLALVDGRRIVMRKQGMNAFRKNVRYHVYFASDVNGKSLRLLSAGALDQ